MTSDTTRVPLSTEEETGHKLRFLYSVFLLAGVVAFGMAFIRWQSSALMGAIDLLFSGINFSLLLYLRRHRQKVELVSNWALALCFILFLSIYLLAPYNTTRIALFFLLAASAFFLKGRQAGRLWLAGILVAIVAGHALVRTGYSNVDVLTTCIYLIALFFIFENYELFKEQQQERKRAAEEALRAKEAAEAANLAKSRFLATMSHEIRTPMNGMLGMAQLLLMPGLSEEEQREYVRTILNSGQTLLSLLNDILDLSKVEAGKLELAHGAFDPGQIVDESAALFAASARSKGLEIEVIWRGTTHQRYRADAMRLRQMLSNLLSNAIKFTAHGYVRLEVEEIERTGTRATLAFSVTDSGIGIPSDKLSLLFKAFSQADSSTTREYGGTGLGLSIVSSLAKLMGGEVGVESEAGKGSRFWFRIPADVLQTGEESRQVERSIETRRDALAAGRLSGHVLVVDDNPVNRKVVETLLTKLGIQADCLENGQQAVDVILSGARPDLVLMDVQMPVMDGLTATARIRRWEQDGGLPHLTIVALTAGAFEEDRQHCIAAGMDDFLPKPIRMDELTAALGKWLGGKRPGAGDSQ
jgi:signal transduction histidine kinase/CheY-like chemotaxis protein